jgi:hypothetical protein
MRLFSQASTWRDERMITPQRLGLDLAWYQAGTANQGQNPIMHCGFMFLSQDSF